ncbi:MAG: hypothetical protein FWC23_04240 [Chitinispirillia bacterium]|nr:hypothetical protein [Chitinispirillia bacterium]MCL2268377.1 hypothetical protein [Chitinispirillia bacterium]
MTKRFFYICGLFVILSITLASAQAGPQKNVRAMLQKSVSAKEIVETARSHQWSINFTGGKDTVHVIAIRIEFEIDTSTLTTGNGRFGMRGDVKEQRFYQQDTVYWFDNLLHDSLYFAHQLTAIKNYYNKVSRGNLTLGYSIYPAGSGEIGYRLPHPMTYYSPGWMNRKKETTDQYWARKTYGLMMFVRDAINIADRAADSPFRNLRVDESGILRDAATGRKTVVLILHAGASYMIDGGAGGSGAADSPSDLPDTFIDRIFFKDFMDTLGLDTVGITVTGSQGQSIVIDEVMMAPETSNQDGLNWGIQGIIVNQLARQLGIPDLHSVWSGVPAIGAFCIMDYAGYSAGQGFIPPYPSAWVRAFMGWDRPVVAGAGGQHRVKALTSVLDGDGSGINTGNDTTILLIPINNNEYYLIENRQRNLSGNIDIFNYDDDGKTLISAYPYNVNIQANVRELSGSSRVILEAKNNDVSLPASGVLVWHIDERVIRQMLAHNLVNADSAYRGVRLVEADGISDLGVMFVDAFNQPFFDYGGAEDVFPHRKLRRGKAPADISGFGPYTRPSTRSNDGGHSYLNINITAASTSPRQERKLKAEKDFVDTVINFSDEAFLIDVKYDHIVQGWPRRAAPEKVVDPLTKDTLQGRFFDPLITEFELSSTNKDTVLAVLSQLGRLYLYSVNGSRQQSYGDKSAAVNFVDYMGKTVDSTVSVTYFDSIPGAYTFPTAINNRIFIPSTVPNQYNLYIYESINANDKSTVPLPAAPTSYVCGIGDNVWAVGLADGKIITGVNGTKRDTIQLKSTDTVNAIAMLRDSAGTFAAIQGDGTLSIIRGAQITASVKVQNGIAPFSIVTGDMDGDTATSEIVISDGKQGIWVYTRELKLANGWNAVPNDWASSYYRYIDPKNSAERSRYPMNRSAPALADINRDGALDIVVGGIGGIYALNRRGALLSRWPAYLDTRYWYQRGAVATSPIVVSMDKNNQPLVLFSSPTGERVTFEFTKIEAANKDNGVVTFRRSDGTLDSLWDLSASLIDTILTIGDSLISPIIMPGGFVDALTGNAARPLEKMPSWAVPQSRWPLSAGAPVTTSPLVHRTAQGAIPDLFAVASDGMVYRWKLNGMASDSLYWPQNGFDAARSFAYGGPPPAAGEIIAQKQPIEFWNYPNPTAKDIPYTTFKYRFSDKATNVRLDIQSITGRRMDTFTNLRGDFPDWNELRVELRKYGPGIYRCRMEATIKGKKYTKMWKMAVVK